MNKGGHGKGRVAFRSASVIAFFSFLSLYFPLVLASRIIALLIGIDCLHIKITHSLALTCRSQDQQKVIRGLPGILSFIRFNLWGHGGLYICTYVYTTRKL